MRIENINIGKPAVMYHFPITRDEADMLLWFVVRGYFPEGTYNAMREVEPGTDKGYLIPEHAAWDLTLDDEALFTCMGGPLLTKCIALLEQIT